MQVEQKSAENAISNSSPTPSLAHVFTNSSQASQSFSGEEKYTKPFMVNKKADSFYVFPPKDAASGYHYSKGYFDQIPKQLVLFSTSESKHPKYDLINHLRMLSLFQQYFNFSAIFFTQSKQVEYYCERYNIQVIHEYQTNPYKMPLIRDLYQQAYHSIPSHFYGYINSDIVVSPTLFSFLNEVEENIAQKVIPENIEIAGRVSDTRYDRKTAFTTVETYSKYLQACKSMALPLRHQLSADYFIFSRSFHFDKMKNLVIGRIRIDNYLMSLMYEFNGYLIDTSVRVPSFHLGVIGFDKKAGYKKQELQNRNWNKRFIKNIKLNRGGLVYCSWRP